MPLHAHERGASVPLVSRTFMHMLLFTWFGRPFSFNAVLTPWGRTCVLGEGVGHHLECFSEALDAHLAYTRQAAGPEASKVTKHAERQIKEQSSSRNALNSGLGLRYFTATAIPCCFHLC